MPSGPSFNLAIEMLVISGRVRITARCFRSIVSISQSRCLSFQVRNHNRTFCLCRMFQSRNRDSCHFRLASLIMRKTRADLFQSRNRDSCHFRCQSLRKKNYRRGMFQSRNRDSCHFRLECAHARLAIDMFQSRNRDSCHFRFLCRFEHVG